jgi:SAM-dependent methyltransferase
MMRVVPLSKDESAIDFICNICNTRNRCAAQELAGEKPSCSKCGSSVRIRGLLQVLSMELFGLNLALPDFPRVKSLRGLGASDQNEYAVRLAEKLDYRNTFYDREPRFDIANPPEEEFGKYDFIVSSEVFEHVPPPPEACFEKVFRLLKPAGVLVFTVPYSLDPSTAEHFPELHEFGLAQLGSRTVLVNRTREGQLQLFEDLVFHSAAGGAALEMREFSESGLKATLAAAGFVSVRICGEDYRPFGIVRAHSWSLPVAACKGPFALSLDATRDVVEEWRSLKLKFNAEMRQLGRSYWFRAGRKLGFF